jgi:hypothetical protein
VNTERADRVLNVLMTYPNISTKEIEDRANVAAARDWIRRLRGKGHSITMTEKWINGARVCRYTWHAPVAHVEGLPF